MKYDSMHELRDYLHSIDTISDSTAVKYYSMVKKVLKNIPFETPEQIPPEMISDELRSLKTKNDVSAAKRGLLYMNVLFPQMKLPDDIETISKKKRNRSKREFKTTSLKEIKGKLCNVKNSNYKLAYDLMLESGLRVSEIEQVQSEDISLQPDGTVQVFIESAKGGKSTTKILEPGAFANKIAIASQSNQKEFIFPSSSSLQAEALRLGFECHDLRRAYARVKHKELRATMGAYKANEEVRKLLGHKEMRTTKRYLKRRIEV